MVLPLFALLGMAALFGQSSTASLDGIREFDIDALGDRNVHRFMLLVSGTNLTGRGLFGAAVTGEIRDGAISSDTRNSSAFPESPYESRTSAHASQGLACVLVQRQKSSGHRFGSSGCFQ